MDIGWLQFLLLRMLAGLRFEKMWTEDRNFLVLAFGEPHSKRRFYRGSDGEDVFFVVTWYEHTGVWCTNSSARIHWEVLCKTRLKHNSSCCPAMQLGHIQWQFRRFEVYSPRAAITLQSAAKNWDKTLLLPPSYHAEWSDPMKFCKKLKNFASSGVCV